MTAFLFFGCTESGRQPGGTGTTGTGGIDLAGPGNGDGGNPITGAIVVSPPDVTLNLPIGGPGPMQAFTATINGTDITSQATFTVTDMTLGTLTGNLFTSNTQHGGSTTITAYYNGMSGSANVHIRVSGAFTTPDCTTCMPLPPSPAPACPSPGPHIVYPPDNVLLPPNMESISVQFTPSSTGQVELSFTNPATTVTLEAKCNAVNGGCAVDLPQAAWDFIAGSNKGGDAVQVRARVSPDGKCVAESAPVNLNFAEEDVAGAVYYWKSTISDTGGVGGQVWRKSFGDTAKEEMVTPDPSGTCFGCHEISRDGTRMTVNGDDNDSDDEYADVSSGLIDLTATPPKYISVPIVAWSSGQPPGFQTFSPDHTIYIGSSGDGSGTGPYGAMSSGLANGFFQWNGDTAAGMTPVTAAPTGKRPTMPDWSPDGKTVVYVIPDHIGDSSHTDDDHVFGGSLYTLAYMGSNKWGTPTPLIQSQGENNYYPSYSPDGQFLVFDRVPMQSTTDVASNSSFSNPKARVWVLPLGLASATPIDAANLNGTGDVSNSWPRWSPFIQTYKGNRLLWVTFSSTRDYGVKIVNSASGLMQCYPNDVVENPGFSSGFTNCKQPQIWMAAINLTQAGEFTNPGDPSYPAFWLPFQDPTTHNHTAQWTQKIVGPSPSPQPCVPDGQDCTHTTASCCLGICTGNGTCGVP